MVHYLLVLSLIPHIMSRHVSSPVHPVKLEPESDTLQTVTYTIQPHALLPVCPPNLVLNAVEVLEQVLNRSVRDVAVVISPLTSCLVSLT